MKVWILNRLLPANAFFTFIFLNCRAILKTLVPHDKKQLRNLVWNKNVGQVESSHKSRWNKL